MSTSISIRLNKQNAQDIIQQHISNNKLYITAAMNMECTVDSYTALNMFRAQYKGKKVFFREQRHPLNSAVSANIVLKKDLTQLLLSEAGMPTAKQLIVSKKEFTQKSGFSLGKRLTFPVVIKPIDGSQAKGVVTNIHTEKELRGFLQQGFKTRNTMLIEEFYSGMEEYRITVLDHKVIAVLGRIPAHIIGDGKSTIKECITAKNAIRAQSTDIELGKIEINDELKQTLKNQKLTVHSVPKRNQYVRLKNVGNMAAGGEVFDATDQICTENKKLAEEVSRIFNLRLTGIDIICKDIAKPIGSRGIILEVNSMPDISMHHYPQHGKARNVAKAVLSAVFKS